MRKGIPTTRKYIPDLVSRIGTPRRGVGIPRKPTQYPSILNKKNKNTNKHPNSEKILKFVNYLIHKMKVFKFGGASVNSADAVRNVAEILKKYKTENLVIVVSAMGKTTNALEQLTLKYTNGEDCTDIFNTIKDFHLNIINDLFIKKNSNVFESINKIFERLYIKINKKIKTNYDKEYAKIVSLGEMLSTKIIHYYLKQIGLVNTWIDARDLIITEDKSINANVDWEYTTGKIERYLRKEFDINYYKNRELILKNKIKNKFDKNIPFNKILITQGFIGGTPNRIPTTLGREGSDYSAAIFAYCLDADELIIWKDVPGVLNADPKYFEDTHKLDRISYREAIELAYYGASIIHPKTIKPLQNKNIPLIVKSFIHPDEEGTIISNIEHADGLIPSYIFKKNQTLLSISPRDFSFIAEENLSDIFKTFANSGIKINIMQNSAISFSICFDENKFKLDNLLNYLKNEYQVKYNNGLELITIRHYDQQTIDKIVNNRKIILEQKSRLTVQLVVENK